MKRIIYIALVGLSSVTCQQTQFNEVKTFALDLPEVPYNYVGDTANNYIPTLGRVLFYDTRLSKNNSVSCATCHKQASAFSDNVQFSKGFEGKLTTRNSMPIQNIGVSNNLFKVGDIIVDPGFPSSEHTLFWDGRETLLDAQVLRPITNHIEMGMTIDELIIKLNQYPEYKPLFQNAYKTREVTQGRIAIALSKFLGSITSNQTKFDWFKNGGGMLTAAEMAGRDLFFTKYNCNNCHQITIPNGYQFGGGFVDIGLDVTPTDIGRSDVTYSTSDIGKFKIPNLRNVALTAPYMHDGRFNTLEEVIDHYSANIENSPNLDFRLKESGAPRQMNISESEKKSIIAFLQTLTDYNMVTDPKFSSPFKEK